MALKSVIVLESTNPHFGWNDSGSKPSGFPLNWINGPEKVCKSISFGGFSGFLACRAIRNVEDGNSSKRSTKLQRVIDETKSEVSKRLQKDSSSFPSGLSYSSLYDLWILLSFELIYIPVLRTDLGWFPVGCLIKV